MGSCERMLFDIAFSIQANFCREGLSGQCEVISWLAIVQTANAPSYLLFHGYLPSGSVNNTLPRMEHVALSDLRMSKENISGKRKTRTDDVAKQLEFPCRWRGETVGISVQLTWRNSWANADRMVVRGGGRGCNRRVCGKRVVLTLVIVSCAWIAFVISWAGAGCYPGHQHSSTLSSDWSTSSTGNGEATTSGNLSLHNIVFGIGGSAKLWPERKEFIRLWWRSKQMRGFVWHDDPVETEEWDEGLPRIRISEDTSKFRYTNVNGDPSVIRISRIVQETMTMNLTDVQWFVLCDDDTVFSVENLVLVLSKYDPMELYYIGSVSESHWQNVAFSHNMAFGGGGFAISYALAKALAQMQDKCLGNYPHLYGGDERMQVCISELGVPLTRERGFHQMDIIGNPLGLLGSHPITPFVSMHHMDAIDAVFPNLSRLASLQLLLKAMQTEPSNFLQQSICYDEKQGLSFSISTGYVVRVFQGIVQPRELEQVEATFKAWTFMRAAPFDFDLDIRRLSFCNRPMLFFLNDTYRAANEDPQLVVSEYKRHSVVDERKRICLSRLLFPTFQNVQRIRVFSKPIDWSKVPRRQCCHLGKLESQVLNVWVSSCEPGETLVTR